MGWAHAEIRGLRPLVFCFGRAALAHHRKPAAAGSRELERWQSERKRREESEAAKKKMELSGGVPQTYRPYHQTRQEDFEEADDYLRQMQQHERAARSGHFSTQAHQDAQRDVRFAEIQRQWGAADALASDERYDAPVRQEAVQG